MQLPHVRDPVGQELIDRCRGKRQVEWVGRAARQPARERCCFELIPRALAGAAVARAPSGARQRLLLYLGRWRWPNNGLRLRGVVLRAAEERLPPLRLQQQQK